MSEARDLGQAVIFYRCNECDTVLSNEGYMLDSAGDVCLKLKPCARCMAARAARAVEAREPKPPTAEEARIVYREALLREVALIESCEPNKE